MTYITKQNIDSFRANYEKNIGHVDDISHTFGWASHEKFYWEMENWCALIDSLFPDWWPLTDVQNILINIVKFVYGNTAQDRYNKGVDMGRAIIAKVTETINWAQNQITNAVNNMKNRIQTEIIDPITTKINNTIVPALNDAQKRLDSFNSQIRTMTSDLDVFRTNITSFDGSIKSFDNKLASFNSKLTTLDTTASGLQTQLRDAQAKLNEYKTSIDGLTSKFNGLNTKASNLETQLTNAQAKLNEYKTYIDDLFARVDKLEKKTPTGFDLVKELEKIGVKI